MKSFLAFLKKEWLAHLRGGKLPILLGVFLLLGVMNPAVAWLTPWLLETLSASVEGGMVIPTVTEVTSLDCWVQYYKNLPIGLIVLIILEGGIFTREYSSGTLVLSLTKGLSRYKVVLAKASVLAAVWSVCYLLCFGITYVCSEVIWDNSVAHNILLSAFSWWLFGLFTVALVILFSTLSPSSVGVYLGTGGVVLFCYLVGLLPKIGKYLPTALADGNSLIYGVKEAGEYTHAIIITATLTVLCFAASVPIFNKRRV